MHHHKRCLVTVLFGGWMVLLSGDALSQPRLIYPNGIAVDSNGVVFVSDIGAHQVFRWDGTNLSVFAGTGAAGFSGDNALAAQARLSAPHDILIDASGNLLIADTYNHRIRRISRDGKITTIVGNGRSEYTGDDGPAISASLNNPQGLALGGEGNLFIADTFNHVVRRVDTKGNITTFAGTEAGLAGDGGPANKAQLSMPMAVAVARDGTVFISDGSNSRIRVVDRSGIIRTVMGSGPGSGTGGAGFSGDGGLIARAKLFSATDLKFNAAGQLLVCDSGNNRIRLVSFGIVQTIAGSTNAGFGGDGGPAVQAMLNTPQKLAVTPDGSVLVTDRGNHRIRRIDPSGVIRTVLGDRTPIGMVIEPSVIEERASRE